MKIEINDQIVLETTYEKNDKKNVLRKQAAYWHKEGAKYPIKLVFTLGSDSPLDSGMYSVNPELILHLNRFESFEVDNYSIREVFSKSSFKPLTPPLNK